MTRICSDIRKPYAPGACRATRRALCSSLLAMTLMLTAPAAWSACTLSVVGVLFGNYDTFSSVPLDSTGNVNVTCDISLPYTIALSPGAATYASRAMSGARASLNYNLYVDPTRLVVWGDGTGGTLSVTGLGTSANHTVYARVPALQKVPVGTYADTITVTVTF